MLSNACSAAPGYPRSRGMLIKLSPYEQNTDVGRGSGEILLPGGQTPLFHIFITADPQTLPAANGVRGV